MAVTKKNTYEVGVNNDLTNAVANIDYNRIGTDLTSIDYDGSGNFIVKVGSIIEANGNLYAVEDTDVSIVAADGNLDFNELTGFAISSDAPVYRADKGGYYLADGETRLCRWSLLSDGVYTANYLHQQQPSGYIPKLIKLTGTGTFTVPHGIFRIKVTISGGGGGGGGGGGAAEGANGSGGTNGGNTIFGDITAEGGRGGNGGRGLPSANSKLSGINGDSISYMDSFSSGAAGGMAGTGGAQTVFVSGGAYELAYVLGTGASGTPGKLIKTVKTVAGGENITYSVGTGGSGGNGGGSGTGSGGNGARGADGFIILEY